MQIFSEICKSSHPKGRLDCGDLIQPDTSISPHPQNEKQKAFTLIKQNNKACHKPKSEPIHCSLNPLPISSPTEPWNQPDKHLKSAEKCQETGTSLTLSFRLPISSVTVLTMSSDCAVATVTMANSSAAYCLISSLGEERKPWNLNGKYSWHTPQWLTCLVFMNTASRQLWRREKKERNRTTQEWKKEGRKGRKKRKKQSTKNGKQHWLPVFGNKIRTQCQRQSQTCTHFQGIPILNNRQTDNTQANDKRNRSEAVPLVEFMYLVFTCMPGESYHRWLRVFCVCVCVMSFAC